MEPDALRGETPPPSPTGRREGFTLLVVEDEPYLLECVVEILTSTGYRVLSAKDGKDALRVIAESPEPIDLMLSDVVMPEMGGYDLAKRVAAEHPKTRIILFSAQMDEELAREGCKDQGFPLIHKPFAIVELLTTVQAELANPRAKDLLPQVQGP